ncbi:exosortase/archaeosortase family protein [bacterium]|nr:exosortase/archaeosortase family protein [bacterium]
MTTALLRRRDPTPILFALGFAVLYGPLFPELVRDWSGSGDFSHGFLVPVIAGAIVWTRRDRIRSAPVRAYLPGAWLLGAAVAAYALGVAASEFTLQRLSMVAFLGGWVLLVWGPARAAALVFPVGFLLFMIPPPGIVWNAISFPLQLLATTATVDTLSWAGLDVARAGNVIRLPECSLEVAHACSGLRSLVALLAVGAVLAEGSLVGGRGPKGRPARCVVFLAAVPVAVFANAIRVAVTTVLASRYGAEAATGKAHDAAGIAMFALAMGMLWLTRRGVAWIERRASLRSG